MATAPTMEVERGRAGTAPRLQPDSSLVDEKLDLERLRGLSKLRPWGQAPSEALACRVCGTRFRRGHYLALHQSRDHGPLLSRDERSAADAARAFEEEWLRWFRRHVRGTLLALPVVGGFLLVMTIMELSTIPIFLAWLLGPGSAAFAGTLYYIGYTQPEAGERGLFAPGGGPLLPEADDLSRR